MAKRKIPSYETMDAIQKAAYLQGLADGLGKSVETDEASKLRNILIDLTALVNEVVDDYNDRIQELEEFADDTSTELDDITDDLNDLSESVDEITDLFFNDADNAESDEDEEDDSEYEITCPDCGNVILVHFEDIESGSHKCDKCGKILTFDSNFFDDDDDKHE
ncbi:MAG: hypothetical protein LBN42_00010 [Oscillospiraceae bacterium]|jgi:DNA-directed RNA polymerase subunit RPC12/RpoP|nr:hypothetical protein [Oscillospiraceae bacterium]